MKARTRSRTEKPASQRRSTRSHKSREPGKSIESRDLNEDEQDQITNTGNDGQVVSAPENNAPGTGFTLEEEEEREKRRKAEDTHPEEPMK